MSKQITYGDASRQAILRGIDLSPEEWLNALNDRFENLVAAGVIDPTKVVRSGLQNAASIASLMLTTEAIVSEDAA